MSPCTRAHPNHKAKLLSLRLSQAARAFAMMLSSEAQRRAVLLAILGSPGSRAIPKCRLRIIYSKSAAKLTMTDSRCSKTPDTDSTGTI